MTKSAIHLGFEVGTGEPVSIPVSHLCVTGQTQLSGKTTTLEALISRSGLKAIAFVTKRGEGAFESTPLGDKLVSEYDGPVGIPPFFRHKADWQFVGALLGAVLNEKLKYERYWLMNICRGSKTLADVRRKAQEWLDKTKKSEDVRVLTTILAYFDLFMDELDALPFTDKLKLQPGLNVMDLSAYSLPLQMLVISAVVEEVYKSQKNVITIIPEAWEFIPNGKNSPAKGEVRSLIRKGAGLRNFVWIDSQDLAGIDSEVRRQATAVLLLGVQRDQNEVKRTLEHVPKLPAKLKPEDIMTLEKGQFWAAFGTTVKKVYVQPAWMTEELAREVALGNATRTPETRTPELDRSIFHSAFSDLHYKRPTIDPEVLKMNMRRPVGMSELRDADTDADDLDGIDNNIHDRITNMVAQTQEADMDAQEREKYEGEIRRLNDQVLNLTRQIEGMLDFDRKTAPQAHGKQIMDASSVINNILKSPPTLQLFADALRVYLPTAGVIKVEPREVVLKRFQAAEAERIVGEAARLSSYSKELIAFLEARATGVKKSKAVTAVTGKNFANMARDCAFEFEEIRDLASEGWIREDTKNSLVYPNLGVVIKRRVAEFEPSNEDVDQIVGQVMLSLKSIECV